MISEGIKQTEIGEIPEGWEVVRLGDEIELLYGKSLTKNSRIKGDYPVYGSNGIVDCHTEKLIDGPGIVVGRKGSLGKVHYCEGEFWPIDTTYYVSLKNPHSFLFTFYLLTWLRLDEMNSHSTIPGLNRQQVYAINIVFPPLPEQKRIAKTLSTIQKAIEIQDKIIASVRELKKATMERVFTKGLNGEKTKQTEIGEIPEGWEVVTVEELFEMKQGKSLSSRKQTGKHLKPFLRTSNVLWGKIDLSKVDEMDVLPDEREKLLLRQDDLLVCEGGDIGRTAIWQSEIAECYFQNHIHRLRAKTDDIISIFYMYWLQLAIGLRNTYGTFGNRTTIPNLSGKTLSLFQLPKPKKSEQNNIDTKLSTIDRKIEHHEAKKSALQDFFKTAMGELMRGRNASDST